MSELEVVYKEVRVDHSKPVNTSEVLKSNGFNIARPIHSRKDILNGDTIYSQAEQDLCK